MPTVQIVEARHIAPYSGAFWERAYFKLSYIDGNPLLEPIYDTPLHDYSAKKTMEVPLWFTWGEIANVKQSTGLRWATWEDVTNSGWYDDVAIHTLTDVVTQADRDNWNGDPYNLYPTFWRFFESQGLDFEWTCDCKHHYGDNPTTEEPVYMSGYKGNGGIGIEVYGWFCDECPHPDDLCWRCEEVMDDGECVNPDCQENPNYVDSDAVDDNEYAIDV